MTWMLSEFKCAIVQYYAAKLAIFADISAISGHINNLPCHFSDEQSFSVSDSSFGCM